MTNPADGTVLMERYRLDRMIGEGGMGAVWAGYDTKLRREVAIKLMTERISRSDTALGRFEREAMAVARLRSQHIAQVYDYGVHEGNPFMVMELLEGHDLKWFLARHERLNMEGAANIIVQVAKGLHAAHKAGIVHRDLKPANIFLAREEDDELCKVFDFGVAKALTDLGDDQDSTAEGAILGTPRYMAPEQAMGAGMVDHRADIWSLGVIAYQCVTGTVPFVAVGTGHVLVKICTEEHPPPSSLMEGLPAGIDAFFDKALAKDPEERFQSARALASAFVELADMSLSSFTRGASDISVTDSGTYPQAVSSWSGVLKQDDLSNPTDLSLARKQLGGPSSEGGGTLGPATHTAQPDKGRQRWGLVALAAIVVAVGAVGFALTRPEGTASSPAATGEPLATGQPTSTPATTAQPQVAETAQARSSASAATAEASSASRKRPKSRPKTAARPAPPPPPEPAPAASPEPPPPPPPPAKPAPTSKDGLDQFNTRW